jgi:hypothetical protein
MSAAVGKNDPTCSITVLWVEPVDSPTESPMPYASSSVLVINQGASTAGGLRQTKILRLLLSVATVSHVPLESQHYDGNTAPYATTTEAQASRHFLVQCPAQPFRLWANNYRPATHIYATQVTCMS